jgi:hypothetical protein
VFGGYSEGIRREELPWFGAVAGRQRNSERLRGTRQGGYRPYKQRIYRHRLRTHEGAWGAYRGQCADSNGALTEMIGPQARISLQ